MQAFRKARLAIEHWIDDEKNSLTIQQALPADVQGNLEILEIIRAYADWGAEMHDKLLSHVEFMVDNRRKYYQAVGNRVRSRRLQRTTTRGAGIQLATSSHGHNGRGICRYS